MGHVAEEIGFLYEGVTMREKVILDDIDRKIAFFALSGFFVHVDGGVHDMGGEMLDGVV